MKRLFTITACAIMCTFCGPFVEKAVAQTTHHHMQSTTHAERVARRAARLEELAKTIDSIVLSHDFEFNPQTVQIMPAGQMKFLSNVLYTLTVWRGSVDVCLPYYTGIVPPYRLVMLNTSTPDMRNFVTQQTEDGWIVSFTSNLYATIDYTFTFDIHRYGGATLTITNTWYNPVQYTGTITQIY